MDSANALMEIRSRAGLSRKKLAARAGVPTSTITRIETSATDATGAMLTRLAAAAGFLIDTVTTRIPTLADAAETAGDATADWTPLRLAVDYCERHPANAAAVIAACPASRNERSLALLAAVAEVIADRAGIARPAWTHRIPPLSEPWEAPGTPRIRERERDAALPQFAARNILFGPGAIWHER